MEEDVAIECVAKWDALVAAEAAFGHVIKIDPRAAQVATLRFFAGLSNTQAADAMNITVRAVQRERL